MEDILKIATFNAKDNKINRNGGYRKDGISNAKIVADKIKEFDLIGTQELTMRYVGNIQEELANYRFYGDYRYGNINIPYNESNHIVTKKNVINSETIWLPWIPNNINDLKTSIVKASIMPRIATIVIVEDENKMKFCMINTHLDYEIESIQIRQLRAIKGLVEKYSKTYPIILTGDFNMELDNNNFNSFVNDMKDLKVEHVDIDGYSWFDKEGNQRMLDHIFVPNDWKVEDAYVDDDQLIGETSDHKPVVVEIRR